MISISSALQDQEGEFKAFRELFEGCGFVLGGNWDYEQGCFDCALDEARRVWVRIPFRVTRGKLDGASDSSDAPVRLGCPFVLRHLYEEGLDGAAQVQTYGGLIDQFQEPADKDAEVDAFWLEQAEALVRRVETRLASRVSSVAERS